MPGQTDAVSYRDTNRAGSPSWEQRERTKEKLTSAARPTMGVDRRFGLPPWDFVNEGIGINLFWGILFILLLRRTIYAQQANYGEAPASSSARTHSFRAFRGPLVGEVKKKQK